MIHNVITVLRPYLFVVFILKKNGDHASGEPILCLLNTYSLYYRYIKYVFCK
jgi:hypothetical protein